jgi:hypothetical protein
MSRKSKSKGGSTGYKAVPKATQAQADKALSGIMDKQTSFLTSLLGPLVERGEAMMAENPGFTNFMHKTGQAKDSVDNALLGPGSLLSQLDEVLGIERSPQPDVAAPNIGSAPHGLTPEQLAQMGKHGGVNSAYPTGQEAPFDINNYMRNHFKL